MPIIDQESWKKWVDANTDPYGRACIIVANEVMAMLDENAEPLEYGYHPNPRTPRTPHAIICKADDKTKAGGITGFMAGCVAQMVRKCHSRGEEFWDRYSNIDKNLATIKEPKGGKVR